MLGPPVVVGAHMLASVLCMARGWLRRRLGCIAVLLGVGIGLRCLDKGSLVTGRAICPRSLGTVTIGVDTLCENQHLRSECTTLIPCAHKLSLSAVLCAQPSVKGDVSRGENNRNYADGLHRDMLIKTLANV